MSKSGKNWKELVKGRKSCAVYFLPARICVIASARTLSGFEISVEPVFELDRASSHRELNTAVLSALRAFQTDVEPPDPRKKDSSPVLRHLKMKTWRQLEREALLVEVRQDRQKLWAMSTSRDKRLGGYKHLPDKIFESDGEEQIGAASLLALRECS